jgi:hypothetical protein
MRKTVLTTACAAAIGLGIGFGGTAQAATPISMGAAQAVVTLPSGCTANDFKVVNWTDGSYHGYIQATCSGKADLFYLQRNATGQWALRTTTIDMPKVYATAVDSTGTYFVGKRTNGNLVLVRRNNDGSLSGVHELDSGHTPIADVSLAAENGNYWAVWDHIGATTHEGTDVAVLQATTIAPTVAPTHVGYNEFSPSLVLRGSQSPELFTCYLGDTPPPESNVGVQTETNHKWANGKIIGSGCDDEVITTGLNGSYFNGHTYLIDDNFGTLYSDVSGTMAKTGIDADTVLGLTGTRVDAVNGDDVYTQNTDGSFPSSPTGTLTAAPVPVHQHQVINRSGKLIRLFVQKDSAGHPGTRLLQQIQS